MSVRKRAWKTSAGESREAWIVDYTDVDGERHIQTFPRKKEADEFHNKVRVDVREGVHTPASKSVTVAEAARHWLAHVELKGRERSTLAQYRQHVDGHIVPRIGRQRLAQLTAPSINSFCDDLLQSCSRAMARKVLVSLKSILREAQRRGGVSQNVALGVKIDAAKRGKTKLRVGVDVPSSVEVQRLLSTSQGKTRAILAVLIFAGLRASELRGLRWADVDLKKAVLHVRQRADRYNAIGLPKSNAGERSIPLPPFTVNTLREWKVKCPPSEGDLVFPTRTGKIDHHKNVLRTLSAVMVAAGVTEDAVKKTNPEPPEGKYALHAFRLFFAWGCINRMVDGGLELPAKVVQERLGHASIVITMDTYGHLFPRNDDTAELALAERHLVATAT